MQNGTLIQFFEWYSPADGQQWNRFKQEIPRLLSMGITAAWLPPAYKGTRGGSSEGYDVYDIYDLGEFDQKGTVRTKYGTKEEYIEAVKAARQAGMKIYVDVVLNHMGGAEDKEKIKVRKVDPENRTKFISDEMEISAYTKFTFPGRAGKYSQFQWDHQCFSGVDYASDPKQHAIFKILNEYGNDWGPLVHHEKGNFDYLMMDDIEMRNPAVRQELKNWVKWYYDTVHFDGVRLDAVKHINPSFFNEWLDYVRSEIGPGLFAVGEYWLSHDLDVLLKYIDATGGRLSLFDVPLHHNFSEASMQGQSYDLRKIFDFTLAKANPVLAVTFVDSHDTQPLQSLEYYTKQWFRPHAYALMLLREAGYPCVFYPDLYGADYKGKNKAGEDHQISIPVLDCLPALLTLRKEYSYGRQVDYFDEHNCIGWIREGIEEKANSGCAVVLSNHPQNRMSRHMEVGKKFAGKKFYDFLQHCKEEVMIDENGTGEFFVEHGTVSVWIIRTTE